MSELKVTIEEVKSVEKHPNADRLDIITVLDWNCVVSKDSLKVGDKVVYFPIDSILPEEIENLIFGEDSKIKLSNSRVRTIKIRGAISQGLSVPISVFQETIYSGIAIGFDVTKSLGITKYEPKEKSPFTVKNGQQTKKKNINPNFKKYTDINHGKNYPNVLEGKEIVITEKLHGTNFRAGYVPIHYENKFDMILKKIKMFFFRKNHKYYGYDFAFGSHNVQLQSKKNKGNFDRKKNVYEEIVDKYDLRNKLNPGEVVYGEIYGDGIQKNYNYGLKNEIDFAVFDIMIDGKYVSWDQVKNISNTNGLKHVPELYTGTYDKSLIDKHISGPSVLCKEQKVREGIVVRTENERVGYMGRMIFKFINPEYLLKDNSEWH